MLAFFRRSLTSWPVLVLFGLILVAFAVTGVNDPFGSSAPAGAVARVGTRTISEPDLLQAIDRTVRDVRQRDPSMTQAKAARDGLVELVTTQLVGQAALEEMARTAGLGVGHEAVDLVIAGIPAFQVGGKFDQTSYERLIAQQGLTDKKLRASITGDLLREQVIKPTTGALAVPDAVAELYARLIVDRHEGAIAAVPAPATTPATAAETAAWYAANAARFQLPERRGFRYAVIDRARVAAGITVPDAAIAAAFAKDPARYGGAATRVLEQVVVPDEAKAKALATAAAKQGFARAAQDIAGFGAQDIAVGTQTQAGFARATGPEVAAAAFALPAGGISAPVKSALGWHVVRVASIGPAGKTLAQARPAIEAELKARMTDDAVSDLVARIEDGVEAGKSFADIAAEQKLAITAQAPVTRDGKAAGQPAPTPLPADVTAIAARAFKHEPADGPLVEDMGGGRLVVVETTSVVPAAPAPLAEVQALAASAAAQDKALKAARSTADAVLAAVKKGTGFAQAVAAAGLAAPRPLSGRRLDLAGQAQIADFARVFLEAAPGSTRIIPGPTGWLIIHVDRVIPGDPRAQAGLIEASRRQIGSALPGEMAGALANASIASVGVNRNAATIRSIRQRLSGEGAQ